MDERRKKSVVAIAVSVALALAVGYYIGSKYNNPDAVEVQE